MMQQFLKNVYTQAINLDSKEYDIYFPKDVKRADFLLFGNRVICEFKDIEGIKIQDQVEKLFHKGESSEKNFKRDFYNSINKALNYANKQIEESKKALNLPNALGLVILENSIQDDLSVLSLIDAANRKMLGGLVNIDCILCLDSVNIFSNSDGSNPVRPAQTIARDTEQSRELCKLLDQLMRDFCKQSNLPILEGYDLKKGDQVWLTDIQGKYEKYEAKIDFEVPELEVESCWKQRLFEFINKWWWLIPVPAIFYDWFIN
ncbi:hypothetical protein [Dolichospermum circinale]|jgi:hypothetical protein|uniref:hypothetical protein n=1 Tax=Dolichospermum circinale TaxID=109265 RepID=UPI002330D495|nr:hypothetical protein [Dolichospermum circinale]MDB9449980.1 hypothetical protein [Dolichospermum circinale CS-547]